MNQLHLYVHEVRTTPKNDRAFVMYYRRNEQIMFQHMRFVMEVINKKSRVDRLVITDIDETTNTVLFNARLCEVAPLPGSFVKGYSSCRLLWVAESSSSPEFPDMWLDEPP